MTAEAGPGITFGEGALLIGGGRSRTAVVVRDALLVRLPPARVHDVDGDVARGRHPRRRDARGADRLQVRAGGRRLVRRHGARRGGRAGGRSTGSSTRLRRYTGAHVVGAADLGRGAPAADDRDRRQPRHRRRRAGRAPGRARPARDDGARASRRTWRPGAARAARHRPARRAAPRAGPAVGLRPPPARRPWLATHAFSHCHHVRRYIDDDVARVARHLTGRAVGLVLGGGGRPRDGPHRRDQGARRARHPDRPRRRIEHRRDRRRSGRHGLDVGRDARLRRARVDEPVAALRPHRAHGVGVVGPARPPPARGHVRIAGDRGLRAAVLLHDRQPQPVPPGGPPRGSGGALDPRQRQRTGAVAAGRRRRRRAAHRRRAAEQRPDRRHAPRPPRPDHRRRRVRGAERDDRAGRASSRPSGSATSCAGASATASRASSTRSAGAPCSPASSTTRRRSSKPTSTSPRTWRRSASAASAGSARPSTSATGRPWSRSPTGGRPESGAAAARRA